MCATRQNENDMIRNLHSYWSINNFLHHEINKERIELIRIRRRYPDLYKLNYHLYAY